MIDWGKLIVYFSDMFRFILFKSFGSTIFIDYIAGAGNRSVGFSFSGFNRGFIADSNFISGIWIESINWQVVFFGLNKIVGKSGFLIFSLNGDDWRNFIFGLKYD